MAKFCVFCGKAPKDKTKEHVIPQWLIELTGDPSRKVALGWDKAKFGTELVNREFAFDQLVFPACDPCNQSYSQLEVKAQQVMLAILDEREVETTELSKFLDWLDKVRVGLWLGFIQLDKNYANIAPNFHIDGRIGQHDRMVIIEKSNIKRTRLNFSGVDCLSFSLAPSAFMLAVNNYYFTNISSSFLFANRIGFPYPSDQKLMPDGRLSFTCHGGTERIMRPLIRRPIRPGGVVLYQPMFKGELIEPRIDLYETDYVRSHSLDFIKGIGNIYVEEDGALTERKSGEKFSIVPKIVRIDHRHRSESSINIFEWQNWLTSKLPDLGEMDKRDQKNIKSQYNAARMMNNALISHCREVLKNSPKRGALTLK